MNIVCAAGLKQIEMTVFKLACDLPGISRGLSTVIPRYNAPRHNADLVITRFFTPKVFLPHL